MTRWFTIGAIWILTVLAISCVSAGSPIPKPAATPGVTPTPPDGAAQSGAEQGDIVTVHYTGRLEDGTVFDSSEGKAPLEFTIGQGRVIPGFEQGVLGMEPGQSKR